MKFTRACTIAAVSATFANAQTDTVGISEVFNVFGSGMLQDVDFYKGLLLNMQRDAGNTETDCMSGFDDYL